MATANNNRFIKIEEAAKITQASWGTVQTWCRRPKNPVKYKIEPAKEGGKDQWLVWLQDILDYLPLFMERKKASKKANEGMKPRPSKSSELTEAVESVKTPKAPRKPKAPAIPQPKPISDERQLRDEWGVAFEAIMKEANDFSYWPKVKDLCEEVVRDIVIQRESAKLRHEIEAWEIALSTLRSL